jgi:hypothetical protein
MTFLRVKSCWYYYYQWSLGLAEWDGLAQHSESRFIYKWERSPHLISKNIWIRLHSRENLWKISNIRLYAQVNFSNIYCVQVAWPTRNLSFMYKMKMIYFTKYIFYPTNMKLLKLHNLLKPIGLIYTLN